ncbi:MAG: hypothetical protein ACLRTG_09520 [Enterocloster aldenensis]
MNPVEVRSSVPVINASFRGERRLDMFEDGVKDSFMRTPGNGNY